MGLLPGGGAGEGVAGCLGSIVPPAATRGQPCLCVMFSIEGKVREGADSGPIGVEELHSSAGTDTGLTSTSRYQDH